MSLDLKVPDMACGACADTITKAIQAIDAQASVQADPQTKQVAIASSASPAALKAAITEAGYTVEG